MIRHATRIRGAVGRARARLVNAPHMGSAARLPFSPFLSDVPSRRRIRRFIVALRPYLTGHALIRLGARNDGGYLVPDDLEGIVGCFSPGVGGTTAFECDIEARGIPAFLLDGSVAPPEGFEARFEAGFLGPATTPDTTSLADWISRWEPPQDGDLILQMDIEGAEWEVLRTVPRDVLRRFRIILVELHDLGAAKRTDGLARLEAALGSLLEEFVVVHLHPNNCCRPVGVRGYEVPPVLEVSLLRRDRVDLLVPLAAASHPLDRPNVPRKKERHLSPIWGRRGGAHHRVEASGAP